MVARRMLKDLYVCVSGTVNWNLLLAHITKLVKLGAVTHNYLTLLEFPELVFPKTIWSARIPFIRLFELVISSHENNKVHHMSHRSDLERRSSRVCKSLAKSP
jgi:hypothetical protein